MTDLLALIAELSVAIAGFTAVFSVLDQRGRASHAALQRHRIRQMLILSLVTALASLLPLWLGGLGLEPDLVWGVSGFGSALTAGSFMVYIGRMNSRAGMHRLPGYSRSNAVFMWSGGVITLGLYIGVAVIGGHAVAPGLYSTALLLSLTMAGVQFVRAALRQMDGATQGASSDSGTT